MTVMQALREATWATHLRLEKRLEIKCLFSELVRYREHIARLEAFHRAAEAEWGPALEQVLPDFEARRKAPLLARDLEARGRNAAFEGYRSFFPGYPFRPRRLLRPGGSDARRSALAAAC